MIETRHVSALKTTSLGLDYEAEKEEGTKIILKQST